MFAKSGKGRANARKRSKDEDEDGADDNTSAVVRNKKQVTSALFASTSSGSKKKEDHSYESARTVVPTIGQDNNALAPALEEDEKDGPVVVGGEDTNASGAKLYKGQAGYQKLIAKGEVMDKYVRIGAIFLVAVLQIEKDTKPVVVPVTLYSTRISCVHALDPSSLINVRVSPGKRHRSVPSKRQPMCV